MQSASTKSRDWLLLASIVTLTIATGYIHYRVGGTLLLLNAAGYFALAAAVIGAVTLYRRALPLVLITLAGYAGITIVAWVVMGPYFDLAYLAKAIEVVLIVTIGVELLRLRR